jgi:hypothetical protein
MDEISILHSVLNKIFQFYSKLILKKIQFYSKLPLKKLKYQKFPAGSWLRHEEH